MCLSIFILKVVDIICILLLIALLNVSTLMPVIDGSQKVVVQNEIVGRNKDRRYKLK